MQIEIGDRVLDKMDNEWRTIIEIHEDGEGDGEVFMADGGVMSVKECENSDILLPGEKV